MKKTHFILCVIYLLGYNLYSQGSPTCAGAEAICAGTGFTFNNNTTFSTAESGIDYDCLVTQPYPSWFFIKIQNPGNLDFEISQVNNSGTAIDVDFIAWGPFNAPSCGSANLNSFSEIGCSYSIASSEYLSINNTLPGQYYMLLITNYSTEPGQITLTQTNTTTPPSSGAGSTDCDVICPLSISGGGIPVCAGSTLTAIFDNSTTPTFQWYFNNVLILGATGSNYKPTQSGTYSVVANSTGCVPNQTISTVVPDPTPVPIKPPLNPLTACIGTSFNLTTNTPLILSGLNAADYKVNYHLTLAGAENLDASIPTPTNLDGVNGQTIYISIQDLKNGGCVTTAKFNLSFVSCVITATDSGPICEGGTFNLNATNVGTGYTYSWTGPGFTSNVQNPTNIPQPTGTPPFVYTVTATGAHIITASTILIVNQIPKVSVNSATICLGESIKISATPNPNASYSYQWTVPPEATPPGNVASFTAKIAGTYSVIITNTATACSSNSASGILVVNPLPEVFSATNSIICSGDTTDIILSPNIAGTTFSWTVSQNGIKGASNSSGLGIKDKLITTGANLGKAIYKVTPTYNGCSGLSITITVLVNPAPIPNINDGIICVKKSTGETFQNYTLDTHLNNNSNDFLWYFNGHIIPEATNKSTYSAYEAGNYGVIVKNNTTGCVSEMTTANVIASFPGEILSISQTLAFSDNGTIVVNINGDGTYQYQLDGEMFQNSNTFSNLLAGLHTISVRDIYGCTSIGPIEVSLIDYPHFFSPNGDGINDLWNVIGMNNIPNKISIFDRNAKLLKQISSTGLGWDGTYNGIQLPSTDYWFTIEYIENGENKIFKSHFSMKR